MSSWIKSLFGGGEVPEPSEELSKLLEQAKRDKRALGELLKRADKVSKSFLSLAEPLAEVQTTVGVVSSRVAELQQRIESVEVGASAVDDMKRRSEEFEASHQERSSSLKQTASSKEAMTCPGYRRRPWRAGQSWPITKKRKTS